MRRYVVRVVLYGLAALMPLGGAIVGTSPPLVVAVTIGAVLCAIVVERELDRVAPLAGSECSFCGRPRDVVGVLLTGPGSIGICDKCVRQCNHLLDTRQGPAPGIAPSADPWHPPA